MLNLDRHRIFQKELILSWKKENLTGFENFWENKMLVLTRRLGEAITIGDNVKLIVVEIDGNQVKLGIEAPREIEIYREELFEKIKGISFDASKSSEKK